MAAEVDLSAARRVYTGFCVFCYKMQSTVNDDDRLSTIDKERPEAPVDRFLTLIQRYLEIPDELNVALTGVCNKNTSGSVRMDPCDVCAAVVVSFNELYHEMKCSELKLQLKILTLLGIMRDGGKVVSRKRSLREALGLDGLRELVKGRKTWARHCSRHFLKLVPRVKVEKISTPIEREPVQEARIKEAWQWQSELMPKWILSLTAVACLLTNNVSVTNPVTHELERRELDEEDTVNHPPPKKFESLECDDYDYDAPEGSNDIHIGMNYVSRTTPSIPSMADTASENQKERMELSETRLENPDELGYQVKRQVEDTDTSDQEHDGDHCATLDEIVQTMKPIRSKLEHDEEEGNQGATLDTPVLTPAYESRAVHINKVGTMSESVARTPETIKNAFSCTVCKGGKTFETYTGFLSHKRSRGHRSQSNQKPKEWKKEKASHKKFDLVFNSVESPAEGPACETKSEHFGLQHSISSPITNECMNSELELCNSDNDVCHDDIGNLSPLSSSSSESDDREPPTPDPYEGNNQQVGDLNGVPRNQITKNSVDYQVKNGEIVGEVMEHDASEMEPEAVMRESIPVPVDRHRHRQQEHHDVTRASNKLPVPARTSYNLRKRAALVARKKNSSSSSSDSVPSENDEDEYKNSNSSSATHSGSDTGNDEECSRATASGGSDKKRNHDNTRKRKAGPIIASGLDIPNESTFPRTAKDFSRAQVAALELEFKKNTSLEQLRRIELSVKLKLTEKQIDSWWRYQRNTTQRPEKPEERQKSIPEANPSVDPKRMYICKLDECQFKTRKEENYNSHQKLHQLGTYPCSFCSKNQLSPMLLCIHEASEHSQNSTDPESRSFTYRCPRCPLKTSYQIAYADHFASVHLGITGLPVLNPQVCPSCHVEVKFPKRHFRLVHDTTDIDADKIVKCPEGNCEVVFNCGQGLEKHRREYHKIMEEPKENPEQPNGYLKKCEACPVAFTSVTTYQRHKVMKHKHRCPIQSCNRNFLFRSELEGHSKLHKSIKCTKCGLQYGYLPEFLRHDIVCSKLTTSEGLLSCPDCSFTTKCVLTLTCHRLETHLGQTLKIYKCTVCSSTFPTNDRRKNHVLSQHGDTPNTKNCFKCSECPAYFTRRISLVSHKIMKHKIAGLWKCKHCGVALSNGTALRKHVKSKHSDVLSSGRVVSCDQPDCGEKFHETDDLLWHQTFQCASLNKFPRSKCKICGKPCRGRGALRLHMKAHKAKINTVLECGICGRRYHNKQSFRVHMLYHKDPKEWKHSCGTCSKKFATKNDHDRHVKAEHVQLKEYNRECGDCKEVFQTEKGYRVHRRKAHDIFKCPIQYCPVAFPEESDVELHKKLHGDYECSKCHYKSQLATAFFDHELKCHDMKVASRYKCPDCSLIVKNKSSLIDHRLETHLGVSRKIFKCQLCSDSFVSIEGRKSHSNKHHSKSREESACCDKCRAYFNDKLELDRHVFVCHKQNESSDRKLFCEKCREQFKTENEFETHSKFHGQWKCQFCPVVEEYASDLALHEAEKHSHEKISDDKISCPRCEWMCRGSGGSGSFKSKMKLANHFVSKHLRIKSGVYTCDLCKRGFFTLTVLKEHQFRLHKPKSNRTHKCDECQKYFPRRATLLLHKNRNHPRVLEDFKCELCGKVLGSRHTYRSHMERIHKFESGKSGGKGFTCDQQGCKRSFDTADDLLYHKAYGCRVKPEVSQVICQICGKICQGQGPLKVHMKVHNPSRPTEWKCDICGKTYKQKAALQMHQEYHKGPELWKFMCAVCSKKCASRQKLDEHMRTHSKEKPFVCQVCGEKYAHKHNLQAHIKSKHKEVQLEVKKHVQRISVSRKGKKLGTNFCFMRDKDLEEDTTGSDSSD